MTKKFICNGMLGKLCKLLRICGIDTLYSNQGMTILLEARQQDRIILTRNTRLRGKKSIFFIQTSDPGLQLEDVVTEHDLQNHIRPFSRCIECNSELEPTNKESIRDNIPYYTYKHFDKFAVCPNCKKVYWEGSHYKNMVKEIENIRRIISKSNPPSPRDQDG